MSAQNPGISKGIIEEWAKWEMDEGFHSPLKIEEGESEREHLIYSLDRLERELEEAIEVAETVEKVESSQEIDEEVLEYTNDIEREYSNLEIQAKDELGYEIADTVLFTLKVGSTMDTYRDGAEIYLEELASIFDEAEELDSSYEKVLEELHQNQDPERIDSFAYEILNDKEVEEDRIDSALRDLGSKLGGIVRALPRSLSDYVADKVDYNQERDTEEMDASFDIREKWVK